MEIVYKSPSAKTEVIIFFPLILLMNGFRLWITYLNHLEFIAFI